jgi:hypothetical protein
MLVTHVAGLIQSQVLNVLNAVLGLAVMIATYIPSTFFVTPDLWNNECLGVACQPDFLAPGMSVEVMPK